MTVGADYVVTFNSFSDQLDSLSPFMGCRITNGVWDV